MSKRRKLKITNTSRGYWNAVLKLDGLGVDAGRLPPGRGPVGKKMLIHCGGKRNRPR